MNKKTMLILCVLLLLALVIGAFLYGEEEVPVENAGTVQNGAAEQSFLTYQGQEYPIRDGLQTVLLIGTDGREPYKKKENSLQDYYNFNQADVLMLLVLDRKANTAEVIQLNRDTMTNVPWLDVLGNYGGTEFKQLCLAFNYGDGGVKSCKNTVDAVSRLLMNAPIDGFVQLPISAIGVLNDLVGGVPVTMPEDLTLIDPGFTKGASVHLNGNQAERFLRVRMELEDDTNQARMARQRIYMASFQNCFKEALASDGEFSVRLVESLGQYMQTNLTAQQLSDLMNRLDAVQIAPIRTPEGELKLGEQFYEFYADETSLWETVKRAYCQ